MLPTGNEDVLTAIAFIQRTNSSSSLHFILDACQVPELLNFAREQQSNSHISLFKGGAAAEAADVAPYFSRHPITQELFTKWMRSGTRNAGILIASSATAMQTYRHLRSIFTVRDENGQEYFFRYYDPRVLHAYLPTCTAKELKSFFGPITTIAAESSADAWKVYWLNEYGELLSRDVQTIESHS